MAVSAVVAVAQTVARTPSLESGKLYPLSSFQLPIELRQFNIQSLSLKSNFRPTRSVTLVASSKKSFSSFDDLLEKSNKPVFVDFYATWCGPCQYMVPVLEQVSSIMKDKVLIAKVDTEKYPDIADKYKIAALPTFILFVDGKPSDRFEGALSAEKLVEWIENSLQVKQ